MNKPLVERIESLKGQIPGWSAAKTGIDEILADVRELVEAAQQFRRDFSPTIPKGETVSYCFTVGQYNRLSAILRKVGGDIGTASSLPAVEAQNSAVCEGCGGTGEVGGFVYPDQGYETEPCPDCTPQNSAVKVPDDVMAAARFLVDSANNRASATVYEFLQSLTHPTETPR